MTHRTAFVATLSLVALLALAGCGGGDQEGSDNAGSASSVAPDDAASDDTSPATATATCKLKGLPGATASLEQTSDGLVMTFKGLPVRSSGTVLYSVTAYDKAGENGGQVGVKFQGGEQVAFFVFDSGTAEQTNLDGSPNISGDTLTASVAESDLGPLSGVEVGQWSAAYSVNGNDVGTCPGGFDYLPFPSK